MTTATDATVKQLTISDKMVDALLRRDAAAFRRQKRIEKVLKGLKVVRDALHQQLEPVYTERGVRTLKIPGYSLRRDAFPATSWALADAAKAKNEQIAAAVQTLVDAGYRTDRDQVNYIGILEVD